MKMVCKNCGHEFEGNYCSSCGQSADTHQINFKYLRQNIHVLLFKYFHKGVIYSSKQLFIRPGHTTREYLEGKRVAHFEPFSLLVMLAALYGLLFHAFSISLFEPSQNAAVEAGKISAWILSHYAFATCTTLPLYAVGSYFCFRKQGYNFMEHIVLNAFMASQRMLFHILLFPIQIVLNHSEYLRQFLNLLIAFDLFLLIWGYTQFFYRIGTRMAIGLTLLSYFIFLVLYLIVLAVLILILNFIGLI